MEHIFGIPTSCNLTKLTFGRIVLEIISPQDLPLRKRSYDISGYNHWGYQVGDREKFVRRLRRRGVPVIEVQRNDHTVYFVKDPDGNRIEIRM